MGLQQDLEGELQEILPSAMYPIIGELAEFILSLQYNQLSPEEGSSRLTTETSLAHALHHLANHEKSIQTQTSQIQFGEGNQFGDLTFRDVVGGNVFQVHMPLSSSTTIREQNIMFKITRPQEEEVFTKEVILNGTGGKPEKCIRIISWVLENGCYVRPGIVHCDKNGFWVYQCHLSGVNKERYLYAIMIEEADSDALDALFSKEIKTIPQLERLLHQLNINYDLSEAKRLIRRR